MGEPVRQVLLREPLGERRFAPAELPLTVGGAGAHVLLPGAPSGTVAAQLALQSGALCLLPVAGAVDWWHEGRALESARPLVAGERVEARLHGARLATLAVAQAPEGLVLQLVHDGGGNATPPPVLDGVPLEAVADEATEGVLWVRPTRFEVPAAVAATAGVPLPMPAPAGNRRRQWLLGAGGALLLLVLGFFMMASSVQVRVAPDLAPDRVDFAGTWLELGFGGAHLVWPGEYTLHVEKAGYVPGTAQVKVGREAQVVRLALARTPGVLVVDTGGVAAKASIAGGAFVAVPGKVTAPPGTQELVVRAPKYADARVKVEVQGSDAEQSVSVRLEPAFATVTFETQPAGAEVRVDGDVLGRTPLKSDVGAGRREVVLALDGYAPFTAGITVIASEPQKVGPVPLRPPPGLVELSSEPSGAQVSVGGQFRGRTPLVLSLDPGTPQAIEVTRLGYAPASRTLQVAAGSRTRERVVLAAQVGEVALKGTPADAQVFVDGVARGAANQVLRLPAAPARIEVRREGLETFSTTVTPRAGFRQEVAFELLSAAQRKAAAFPGSRRTGLGQELRLLPQATFTLGSARREAGRRSNETQRVVELRRRAYLGVNEVTNAEFRQFRKAHLSGLYKQETLDLDNRPVVNVSWADVAEFCNWLSQRDGLPPAYVQKDGKWVLAQPVTTGYRAPTEAEWELVARWDGTSAARKYPWGGTLPVPARSGNYADAQAVYLTQGVLPDYDDGFRTSAPVGSFGTNPLGIADLGGNVSEWTADVYQVFAATGETAVDPVSFGDGTQWTVRGANWLTFTPAELRNAWRDNAGAARPTLGFRLARYAE